MRRSVLLFLASPLILLILACGGGDQEELPALQAEDVLSRTVAAVAGLQSFHFRLSHENGTTAMPLNLQLVSAEGDVAIPDRLAADIRAKAGAISASVELISVGGRTWITNPFTRGWQRLPGLSVSDVADPAAIVGALAAGLQQVRLAGEDEVGGTTTYHLAGVVDSALLEDALGAAQSGFMVGVDLWVGRDFLPRRARLSGRLAAGDPDNIVRQLDFSGFNAPVDIRPPR